MAGIFHPYYTVALAPAVVALPALAGALLWPLRDRRPVRALAAAAVVTTAAWSFHLLSWTPSFVPWLRPVLLVAAAVAVVLLLARGMSGGRSLPRRLPAVAVGATAAVALLGGSTAYSIVTAGQAHSGGVPRSGPDQDVTGTGGIPSTAGMPDIPGMQGFPDVPGTQGLPGIAGLEGLPGAGGTSRADPELVALARSTDTRWAAAAIGSQTAAQLQIESERPVIAVGGFTGSDPAPTLEQFQTMVRNHEVGYFVAGGSGFPGAPRGMAGGPGPAASGQSAGSQIQEWVGRTFPSRNVGGTTVYDLRQPK
jgi:4-amino-4-deoxy-L-arabinose transferase-like glycosyltransferase